MFKNNLHNFVEAMQARNPNRKVYLIENNTKTYYKISRLLETKRKRRNIIKIN